MLKKINQYFSLIKFSHTVFAMPFAMIGFLLAIKQGYKFNANIFLYMILCMVFARSAAMAFNRYIDRKFDALNPRTKNREVPAGVISPAAALILTIACSLAFMGTTRLINSICFYLSPVALAVILGYSYTKRFTPLCHLILGAGLSLAPIGAYLTLTGQFNLLPVLLSFVVFTWSGGFDIIYALPDAEFDKTHHLYSIPAWLGIKKALKFSEVVHVVTSVLLIAVGVQGHFSFLYWTGALCFIGLLIYQHTLVKPNDLSKVNIAFGTVNGIGSLVFSVFTIADIFMASQK